MEQIHIRSETRFRYRAVHRRSHAARLGSLDETGHTPPRLGHVPLLEMLPREPKWTCDGAASPTRSGSIERREMFAYGGRLEPYRTGEFVRLSWKPTMEVVTDATGFPKADPQGQIFTRDASWPRGASAAQGAGFTPACPRRSDCSWCPDDLDLDDLV